MNELPSDIKEVIYDKVMELRAPKATLHPSVFEDLKSYHLIKEIRASYMNDDNLSQDPASDDYYLHWMDNDMSTILNDDMGLLEGIQPDLRKCFPGLPDFEILRKLCTTPVPIEQVEKTVKLFWINMSPKKRYQMYETWCT
jgi:hypothetical protein